MKRTTMAGLCLVAAFAFSALVAGGALAFKHTNSGIVHFNSQNENAPHLEIKGAGEVLCKSDTATGTIETTTKGLVTAKFVGCESASKKCTGVLNTGAGEEGDITTFLLNTTLGYINKGLGQVGTEFSPHSGIYNAEFECPGTPDLFNKVTGTVIGRLTPANVSETVSHSDLKKAAGAQEVKDLEGDGNDGDVLISEISSTGKGGPFASDEGIQNVDSVQHNENQVVVKGKKHLEFPDLAEVKTGGPEPEYGRCVFHKKKGAFSDANCQVAENPADPDGNYDWHPIPQ